MMITVVVAVGGERGGINVMVVVVVAVVNSAYGSELYLL